ncbi:amidase [Brevibacterium sp. 50QC2O2]|uniref:amidase n=1 Tax=Brevibacterium sp. 50QC2O2 TaxID=2968459 RepID=UPI00211BE5CC|nr:amidase [Brevibacterium sp. 50QC2O2]MCQ9387266.1 amidase [Brevibacterium sp. 50QC2O2]
MDKGIAYLELTEIAELIRTRRVTSTEVTNVLLERIAALDPQLQAYATVTRDRALSDAATADAEIDRGHYRGALHGVPIALKDLVHTAGITTTAGTTVYQDFVPDRDGTVAARLRAAGAVLLGKLRMTEGAFSAHHPDLPTPVNPWDRDTWSGVSSSGSGVAVAAGLAFGALGSDTGGSIRLPSGANGVTGLKPTWGRVSRAGIFDLAPSLDHIGPMTRSARDAAVILETIAGWDPADATTSTKAVPAYSQSLRLDSLPVVGVDRVLNATFDSESQEMLAAVEQALSNLGWRIVEITTPDFSAVADDWSAMCGAEAALVHEATYPDRKSEYGPVLADLIELGRSLSAVDLERMSQRRRKFSGSMNRLMDDIDILLLPSVGTASPTIAEMDGLEAGTELFTRVTGPTAPIDMCGLPSLTLPSGFTERGTPLGVQFVGPQFSEDKLLAAGDAFQHATDHHRRHPALDNPES